MSTPTPIIATTPVGEPTDSTISAAADVTAVPKTAATAVESLAGSATSATVPPEASESTAELIKKLDRKRLELEAQIKQLREEAVKSFPATSSPVAATFSSLPDVLKNLIGRGLDTPDLAHLREQDRVFRTLCTSEMLERRQVTEQLLPHVFNANPEKVKAFFAKPETPKKMVLTKTSYREGYHSKQENNFICFRRWRRVSPLQAAALSLDNFLVLDLLSHIENDAMLRIQAAIQLQEVLNRKEVKVKAEGESVSGSTGTAAVSSSIKGVETKIKAEDKGKAEAEASADLEIYQAPFKALLKVYKDFLASYKELSDEKNWDGLNILWGNVGEYQKRLPVYGLQEFFDSKPFSPLPSFKISPHRGECRTHIDRVLLDLDTFGLKTFNGLSKVKAQGSWIGRACGGCSLGLLAIDSVAINHLCELRLAELENIISCLLKPGAAVTLRADESVIAVKL